MEESGSGTLLMLGDFGIWIPIRITHRIVSQPSQNSYHKNYFLQAKIVEKTILKSSWLRHSKSQNSRSRIWIRNWKPDSNPSKTLIKKIGTKQKHFWNVCKFNGPGSDPYCQCGCGFMKVRTMWICADPEHDFNIFITTDAVSQQEGGQTL
jgi:hypothetical protein